MSIIQLDISSYTEIMERLGNSSVKLIPDEYYIDPGKMSSEMVDELCRVFELYTEMLYSYYELLLYDKQRILEAKNDFMSVDSMLGSKMIIK